MASLSSQTQKALLLTAKFGDFEVGTRPVPTPGPGELLVKVHATSLNPADWKIQKSGRFIPDDGYPAVLGLDISGEVIEVGEGANGFEKGDRILSPSTWSNDFGSYQQYALTTAATTSKIPENLTYEQASTIPTALACAYVGFYNTSPNGYGLVSPFVPEQGNQKNVEPIFIVGGSSSVGQYAIQLAKLSGFSPIITTSSTTHTEYLKSLGATHVLDRKLPWADIKTSISSILEGNHLQYAFDSIASQETQENAYSILVSASGGKGTLVVSVLPAVQNKQEGIEVIQAVATLKRPENQHLWPVYNQYLEAVLKEGAIKPNMLEVLEGGLGGIPKGLERLMGNKVSGEKLVALPWA